MASATLSLCSSLPSHFNLAQKQNSSFPTTSSLSLFSSLPSISSQNLSFQSIFSPRLPFPSLPKSSESEAAVVESEPEASEVEAVEVAKVSPEQASKREEIFAVVMIGSRQYIVFPGRFLYTQRLKGANVNDKITLNKVLLVGTRTTTYIGKPVVTNAVVHATVEEQGLDDKVIVFKYKPKKKYRRNIGHRQATSSGLRVVGEFCTAANFLYFLDSQRDLWTLHPNTRIRIDSITGYEDYPAVTLDSLDS